MLCNDTSLEERTELNCSALFSFDPSSGTCRPVCGWNPHLEQFSVTFVIIAVVFMCTVLMLFSSINLLLAFTIQRHSLFRIPTFIFVVVNIDSLAVGIIFAIQSQLLQLICEEEQNYFINVLTTSHKLCAVAGSAFYYILIQTSLLLLFYSVFLFWSVIFPFKYRYHKNNGTTKYLFVVALVVSVLYPFSSLALLQDGFRQDNYLTNLCVAKNATHFYVVVTLPLSVIHWVSTSMLLIITWKLFKEKKEENKVW